MEELSTGLTRFGARDYLAASGRWTAKDPLGFGGGETSLGTYAFNNPTSVIDPSGRRARSSPFAPLPEHSHAYDCKQTQELLEWVKEEASAPRPEALYRGTFNHSAGGVFDFKVNEPFATFVVDGVVMRADEFGNFAAGYAGEILGPLGAAGVQAGGMYYDWRDGVTFDLDADSVPDIHAGAAYARREAAGGKSDCDCH